VSQWSVVMCTSVAKILNKIETAGCVPSSAATRSVSGTVKSLYGIVFCPSHAVLLPPHVQRLQCGETTVRQILVVQFGCRLGVFVFTANHEEKPVKAHSVGRRYIYLTIETLVQLSHTRISE
jgi:hypothetical protein